MTRRVSGIWSANRKVSDDVACDLVTLIHIGGLILVCGSTTRSSRLSS